jgi:hypothetical protein
MRLAGFGMPDSVLYPTAYRCQTQKDDARGDVREHRAACLFAFLQPYPRVFRGVSTDNLPGYVGVLPCLRNCRQWHACEQAALILQATVDPATACRVRRGAGVACCDPFDLLHTAIHGVNDPPLPSVAVAYRRPPQPPERHTAHQIRGDRQEKGQMVTA